MHDQASSTSIIKELVVDSNVKAGNYRNLSKKSLILLTSSDSEWLNCLKIFQFPEVSISKLV